MESGAEGGARAARRARRAPNGARTVEDIGQLLDEPRAEHDDEQRLDVLGKLVDRVLGERDARLEVAEAVLGRLEVRVGVREAAQQPADLRAPPPPPSARARASVTQPRIR